MAFATTNKSTNPYGNNPYGNTLEFGTNYFAPEIEQQRQSRENLNFQLGVLPQQYDLKTQNLNNDYKYQSGELGINQASIPRKLQYQDALSRLTQQQLGLDEEAARYGAGMNTRQLMSDATAKGSLTTIGSRQGLTDIQQQLQNQLAGINVSRQRDTTQTTESKAQLNDLAKQYGLQADQLKSNLDLGLKQLGLDQVLDVNEITQNINKLNTQDQMLMRQIIDYAMQYANVFSTAPKKGK